MCVSLAATQPSYSSYSGTFLGGASSPDELVLAWMEQKKYERQPIGGEWGAAGAATGTRSRETVAFDFERIRSGVDKVTPRAKMDLGEYCFFRAFPSQAMSRMGRKLLDFGIN